MDSKICFEMISFVVEAIRERGASFRSLTATVSEICGGQTNVEVYLFFVVGPIHSLGPWMTRSQRSRRRDKGL